MDPISFLLSGAAQAANQSAAQPSPSLPTPPPSSAPNVGASNIINGIGGGGDSFLMNNPGAGAAPATPPPVGTQSPDGHEVQGLTVTAGTPGYGNTQAVNGATQALKKDVPYDAAPPNDAWGLIPGLGHGMVRNIIGNITDGLSMLTGGLPGYRLREERLESGRAIAGFGQLGTPKNVDGSDMTAEQISQLTPEQKRDIIHDNSMKAIDRLVATGFPGAIQQAQQLRESADRLYESGTTQAYTHEYQKDRLAETTRRDDNTEWNHVDTIDGRKRSTYDAMITAAKRLGDANKFAQTQAKVLSMIKADGDKTHISPNEYAGDMDSWNPASGLTANQGQQTTDRAAQRTQSQTNAEISARARRDAARQIISSRGPNDNQESTLLAQKIQNGTATEEDIQRFDRINSIPRGARRPTHNGSPTGGGPAPQGGGRNPDPPIGFKSGGYTYRGGPGGAGNSNNWTK